MQLKETIISSNQALRGNRLRTFLTMLGMVIGISAVILISSIGQGAVAFITDQLSVFGTGYFRIAPGQNPFSQAATTKNPLTTKDADAIRNSGITNIRLVAPIAFTNASVSANDEKVRTAIRGVTPDVLTVLKPEIIYGEFITSADNDNHARVVVLGTDLSDELFGEGANPVGEGIRLNNSRYRVVGLAKASGALTSNIFNSAAVVPINSLISNLTGVDQLFEIVVSVDNEDLTQQTMVDVEAFLRDYRNIKPDEDADFFTQSFKDTLDTIRTITNLLTIMITSISAISLVVGGVGIMNIMLVTVTERTREIGLLKAIGAKEQDILNQFLIEAITISLIGGLVGISVGISVALAISALAHIPFVVSPIAIIFAVTVSTLVGIVFGLYPAKRAAGLNPIDALRHE